MTPEEAAQRGSVKSERKAAASRENGKLGGLRPLPLDEPCACTLVDGKHDRTCRMWWRVYRARRKGVIE